MRSNKLVATSAAVIALALIGASCGKDKKTTATTVAAETTVAAATTAASAPETTVAAVAPETTTVAGSAATTGTPQSYSVNVDGKNDTFPIAAVAYYPKELTAHPGDTVTFTSVFTGEPHTVTFGTLVDAGLAKSKRTDHNEPPELAKIALMIPNGPGDAIQASAQPCYIASGDPPVADACTAAQHTQPDFDGTQSLYNSGFLADGEQFKVKLSANIKPGTYSFFCTLHRAGMTGKITVAAADAKADTPDEVVARGQDELKSLVATLKPAYDDLTKGLFKPFISESKPGSVVAGSGVKDAAATITAFGPDPVEAKVGDTITWTVVGPHTVTFGANEALRTVIAKAPDGGVHLNPASFAPVGGAGQPPPPPTVIDGGSFDGAGLHSSGFILSTPDQGLFSYKLKFTKAGSYPYVCLIHPNMKGTVNVA